MFPSEYLASELVIVGFQGKTLSSETIQSIERERISNFILFAQNYESREQLIELNDELQRRTKVFSKTPALISVDQEGGRVQRFRSGFTLLPTAAKVGLTKSPNLAFDLSALQAKELFSAGVNLNFAPVCDINTNPANPVIGDRAYGDTADIVTRMASAVVRGHLSENVEPCIKHFPGHGDTHVDSHESLPVVHTPIELLKTREWIPFHRAMKSGCNFLMSAHILLPHLDEQNPGTFSPTFLKKYLREELKYDGVIISDDMEMGAVIHRYGKEEAPVLALKAGCNLLCYRSETEALIAIEAIKKAIRDNVLHEHEVITSIERVRKIKSNLKLPAETQTAEHRLATIGNPSHADFVKQNFS